MKAHPAINDRARSRNAPLSKVFLGIGAILASVFIVGTSRTQSGRTAEVLGSTQVGLYTELGTATRFTPQGSLDLPSTIELHGVETWDATSAANVKRAIALLPASVLSQLGNPLLGPVRVLVNQEGRTTPGIQPYGAAANFFSTNNGLNELVLSQGERDDNRPRTWARV